MVFIFKIRELADKIQSTFNHLPNKQESWHLNQGLTPCKDHEDDELFES